MSQAPSADPAYAALRAELVRHRTPLYRGLWPLLDALDGYALSAERRLGELAAAVILNAQRVSGLTPRGESIEPDSPLGRQAAAELERRKYP